MVLSCGVTYYQDSIADAWKFLIAIGAGTGSVLILRWFWWRINAWSEVSAMAASLFVSTLLQVHFKMSNDDPRQFAWIVIITVLCSTAIWLAATFLTAPEKEDVLLSFYRRVRPSASFWGPIARKAADVPVQRDSACNLLDWICGCLLVYMTLFGVGKLIFGQPVLGIGLLLLAMIAGWIIYWDLNRRGWKSIID
jgi:SSS family solute:Na+ symporter